MKDEGSAFIAPNATVTGNVVLGKDSSVWFGCVIRAESGEVRIGNRTNVQDNCVLHTEKSLLIGNNVTIGHGAIVHCERIGDNTLIGMGAVLLNGAKVGKNCIIAAGALVKENENIPDNSVVMGIPGKIKRKTTEDEVKKIKHDSEYYVKKAKMYANGG